MTCESGDHSYTYQGLQWWSDDTPRPGSGATTIRYVHTYYCTRCLDKRFERANMDHDSYQHVRAGALPIARSDWNSVKEAR